MLEILGIIILLAGVVLLFKAVRMVPQGFEWTVERFGAYTRLLAPADGAVLLRAEMDVIIVIANCPHVMDPREQWNSTPLRITAWRGAITPEQDPVRIATPEGQRAFLNTEDYYRR